MTLDRVVLLQAVAAAVSAGLAYRFLGETAARAAWFGGAVAMANTLLLVWRMRAAAARAAETPERELARLVRSGVERFFTVALLLAAGLGWLKLSAAPMMGGFVLGQLTLVVSALTRGIEKQ